MNRFAGLDLLRVIAGLALIVCHTAFLLSSLRIPDSVWLYLPDARVGTGADRAPVVARHHALVAAVPVDAGLEPVHFRSRCSRRPMDAVCGSCPEPCLAASGILWRGMDRGRGRDDGAVDSTGRSIPCAMFVCCRRALDRLPVAGGMRGAQPGDRLAGSGI